MELHLLTELGRPLREDSTQTQPETAGEWPWLGHLWLGSPCASLVPLAGAVAFGGDLQEVPWQGVSEIPVAAAWRERHSGRGCRATRDWLIQNGSGTWMG